jgi:hypothetical protein
MTIRTRFTRRLGMTLASLAALATVAGGVALAAGPASAAPLRPQSFTLTSTDTPGVLDGTAFGPVHGAFTDTETSDTSGTWVFDDYEASSVVVDHGEVTPPKINQFTCSGFAFQNVRWLMTGDSGRYADAFGFGRATVLTFVQVGRHRDGTCNPRRVEFESVRVFGSGLATTRGGGRQD